MSAAIVALFVLNGKAFAADEVFTCGMAYSSDGTYLKDPATQTDGSKSTAPASLSADDNHFSVTVNAPDQTYNLDTGVAGLTYKVTLGLVKFGSGSGMGAFSNNYRLTVSAVPASHPHEVGQVQIFSKVPSLHMQYIYFDGYTIGMQHPENLKESDLINIGCELKP
jgi:hypothetical protein